MTAAPFGQVPRSSWEDVETVYFPYSDLSVEIIEAIYQACPYLCSTTLRSRSIAGVSRIK
jgi:hypothetical protein